MRASLCSHSASCLQSVSQHANKKFWNQQRAQSSGAAQAKSNLNHQAGGWARATARRSMTCQQTPALRGMCDTLSSHLASCLQSVSQHANKKFWNPQRAHTSQATLHKQKEPQTLNKEAKGRWRARTIPINCEKGRKVRQGVGNDVSITAAAKAKREMR